MDDRPPLLIHAGVNYTGSWHMQRALMQVSSRNASAGWKLAARVGRGGLRQLRERISSQEVAGDLPGRGPALILIDQSLSGGPHSGLLESLADRYALQVSLFLLRQDYWLERCYANRLLKSGNLASGVNFSTFLGDHDLDHLLDYRRLLRQWAACVGPDRLRVMPVAPDFTTGNLVAALFKLHGLESEAPTLNDEGRPIEMPWSREIIELASLSGIRKLTRAQRRILANVLLCSPVNRGAASRLASAPEIRAILDRYREANRQVARDYCPDAGEELFDTSVPPVPEVPSLTSLEAEEFLARWGEPLLAQLAERAVSVRDRSGLDSEAMELLIENRQIENDLLAQEVAALEQALASPRAVLRRLGRLLSAARD